MGIKFNKKEIDMLVLGRKPGQSIVLFDKNDASVPEVKVFLLSCSENSGSVRIGIDAPNNIGIYRSEIEKISEDVLDEIKNKQMKFSKGLEEAAKGFMDLSIV